MLSYQSTGAGKTIVFIHALSQSAEVWQFLKGHTSFSGYRLIFIDMPGHGSSLRSTEPEKDYSIKGMAAHIKSCFQEIAGEEYIVVACSLATCLIAEIITDLHGCKGLFFIGGCPVGAKFPVEVIVKPNPYFAVTFTGDPDDGALSGYISTQGKNLKASVISDCKRMFRDTDPLCREQLGSSVAAADWEDEVSNLEGFPFPVALVYGGQEEIIDTYYLESSAIKMWRNAIICIPDSGHCCYLDKPEETALLIAQYAGEALN